MPNLIQIKRSLTTANAPILANGELAFTANGDQLFIGSNGTSFAIAGKRTPGTLTANQALVANGSGFIDAVKTANLTTRSITANGTSSPGAGYLLAVDAGGNTFWQAPSAVATNVNVTFAWTNTHSFANVVTFNGGIIANSSITANGTTGTAGQVLASNGSSVYWVAPTTADITAVNAGSGLTGGASSGEATIDVGQGNGISVSADAIAVLANNGLLANVTGVFVVANNGIVANASGVFAKAANGILVDTTGINVVGGDGLVANTTGVHVGAANGINVTADTVGLTTGSTLTVNSVGVHVNTTLSLTSLTTSDNMQVGGNLVVLGDLLTINVATLAVEDSLIQLAANNTSSDLLDIGFFGNYEAGDAGTHEHTGFFRDASDVGIYKLFVGLEETPTTAVNTAGTGYETGTLQAFLKSGGLISNSTTVTLTSNSTVAVNITANTLSLSTALPVTSGGIGRSSITTGAILVGNGSGATTVLAAGTDGFVLQSNGTSVIYSTLDGGTF